ncbi:MAG: multifunctional oxoglutarate decarboxylase/oxoglutarate dehydrogenase thiamine pyrophosphate-binding subunit/dihydrolipoyllysine-residue succinyltransferase subunit [Bryobacteraceae bacterium]|nr:multifunctional oxoglutarate decarboxylase/oxoglutarate dehydrogenase thiamine pyrophosphate-binding subunit/dihydrolipoyllysine-residue succinyltransferase subunit [Bryobacteraceae bacterium]
MAESKTHIPDINDWIEDELYQHYLHDRQAVDASWKRIFETNGEAVKPAPSGAEAPATAEPAAGKPRVEPGDGEELAPLRGAAARIVDNMNASLSLPLATSQRTIPVKVVEENRRILNHHRALMGQSKVSFTHLIAYALVRALETFPNLNSAYAETQNGPARMVRRRVNLGVAVDVPGKDGARSLLVPNLRNAGAMTFSQFLEAYDSLIDKARRGKLAVEDFQGTTISLTNPGTVGTVGSVPRLMAGQGAIIATGVIDYPAEYRGVSAEMRSHIGLSKVMTITCTYDHRVIQGAESGMFLGKLEELLGGGGGFYEKIFVDLKMPHRPVAWEQDRPVSLPGVGGGRTAEIAKEAAVLQLINAYRVRGHLVADLDPLGSESHYHPELDPANYGLTLWDLDREFLTGTLGEALGESAPQQVASLREILETLRNTYCGKIGCEYMNIQHPEQKRWLQHRMEPETNNWALGKDHKLGILERLLEAEEFEHFLGARFVGHKRFSLEGAEAAIVILDELLDRAADHGVEEAVIGMAHRGRLNVLANVVGKPLTQIFAEFEGDVDPLSTQGSGDVKYHLGATGSHRAPSGRELIVSVSPNPSHLEAVDPVVEGIVRPKQDRRGDAEREKVIPVLVHGDAAFAGQGVVMETLNLSQLPGYHTGGTVHLVINNQIGFTTAPEESRSSPYSTDVAKAVQAPVFHVNGDDPEAAARVVQMAFDYRQQFKKDVVIDMLCYRRHGHNEADDPSFTQPVMYRKIRSHPSVAKLYAERLAREGLVDAGKIEAMRRRFRDGLQKGHRQAQAEEARYEVQELAVVDREPISTYCPRTAIAQETVARLIRGITTFPAGFHLHPKLRGFIERRKAALNGGAVDWALAETLAFGSLAMEGTPVRLSGQDSNRGTFSQRHLAYYDSEDGREYIPLKNLSPEQARFEVFDSSLSEYAVLGFEFGYSLGDPLTLVLWEAQFGDFANGAQIMIDQFITCAESKWGQPSGLVLLLPHGYEGQGPEHSSARIERFLILTAENNIQLANCTTPAQYFHLLRRQMYGGADRRGVRKPLVVFTPKSLLRHPKAVSRIEDLTAGHFQEAMPDALPPDRVGRILLCSGKIYYELLAAREEKRAENVAIVRLEQLYPFPGGLLAELLERYPNSAEVMWVQEEPRNMGPWRFIREKVEPLLEPTRRGLKYIGRADSASPATGSHKRHLEEQTEIIEGAFGQGEMVRRRRVRVR